MLSGLWSFILLCLVVAYHVFSMLCTSAILYSIEVWRDSTFIKGPLITRNEDMTCDLVSERAASCEVHLALTRCWSKHLLHRQFGTSTGCNRSFTLLYTMPDKSNKVKTYTFVSIKDFRLIDWFSVHKSWDKQNICCYLSTWPHWSHSYIHCHSSLLDWKTIVTTKSNKAFEDKACNALEHYLKERCVISCHAPDNLNQQGGWQTLTGEKGIAEWEGVWKRCDGHHFFLEAKHLMDMVSFFDLMIPSILHTHIYRINFWKLNTSSSKA